MSARGCFVTAIRFEVTPMIDVIFVALGLGFFVAAGLYLFACNRL
jgi:biopolymer transport protein ExbD